MRIGLPGLALAIAVGVGIWSLPGEAQQPAAIARIGYLSQLREAEDSANREAFRQGLAALGYTEGKNAIIEARYANGNLERLPDLAADLVRATVHVIVAGATPPVRAAQQATRSIPIVMAFVGDPVADGFISSLARPGGNITGFSSTVSEMQTKRVELLTTIVPKLSHVALLAPPQSFGSAVTETVAAGQALGVKIVTMSVHNTTDIDRAFAAMPGAHVQGVVVNLSLLQHTDQIVKSALKNRLPTISGQRTFAEAGGLLSYGPYYSDLYRRAAIYVDKILRGANPADLPVEQPTKFELVINVKSAKALGLAIPQSVLGRADELIH